MGLNPAPFWQDCIGAVWADAPGFSASKFEWVDSVAYGCRFAAGPAVDTMLLHKLAKHSGSGSSGPSRAGGMLLGGAAAALLLDGP